MNEKNQIKLFRDPLDPRELSFGLSQPHVERGNTSGTGQPRNQFMKNENQISGGDRTQELVKDAQREQDRKKLRNMARVLSRDFRREICRYADNTLVPSITYKTQWLLEEVIADMQSFV